MQVVYNHHQRVRLTFISDVWINEKNPSYTYTPENSHGTQKLVVCKCFLFEGGIFRFYVSFRRCGFFSIALQSRLFFLLSRQPQALVSAWVATPRRLLDGNVWDVELQASTCCIPCYLPCDIGGGNEPGMIYFPAKRGAKELQNPKNHRIVILTQQLANQFKLLGVTYLVAKVKFELFCWSLVE